MKESGDQEEYRQATLSSLVYLLGKQCIYSIQQQWVSLWFFFFMPWLFKIKLVSSAGSRNSISARSASILNL